jgi:alpha-glucosidase
VTLQERDADSMLHFYRRLLHWRREHITLIRGEQTLLAPHEQIFAFKRTLHNQQILCAFNFSDQPARLDLVDDAEAEGNGSTTSSSWRVLEVPGLNGGRKRSHTLRFEPYGGLLLQQI